MDAECGNGFCDACAKSMAANNGGPSKYCPFHKNLPISLMLTCSFLIKYVTI